MIKSKVVKCIWDEQFHKTPMGVWIHTVSINQFSKIFEWFKNGYYS